ncbi:Tol-Pal system protein TolB [Campylobacter corcagiensis]|uniref:Tol-Pal system protein TolB n=1 Tax=Campylobacter corcagiensis TaxID=1448857 RepID=A0A7M1LEY3_9BACT|nr:Tol-Pal system protein TolB [Campylobacter corcagiensis]QKF65241.1 Tol-Pal system translocation protein TolB [Campylobacter corcagiensis]QOQ86624.1 Tol-Pal system protein TolB [Campylobacter corcagiensis]
MRKILFVVTFCIALFANDATTTIVNQGVALPKISVEDGSNLADSNFQNQFFKLMAGDLKVGATFEVENAYFQNAFNNPALSGGLVVKYELTGDKSSSLNLKVKVVENSNTLYEGSFSESGERFPFLAHKAVSTIVKNIGYSDVDWMNGMIVYSVYTSARDSDIYVGDYTLTYTKRLLSDGLNVFPKWANASQSAFYYTYYENRSNPTIYRYDLASGSKTKIYKGSGMLVASDVSSDGSKLLITDAPDEQADIFIYDLRNGSKKRITNYPGIDVSGNFVDGDSRVVFVSDRLGYPNVFATDINGGSVEQMVYHGRNNNSISTNGNYIVYSSREPDRSFNLYLISTQTNYIRQLTADGKNLFPRFSSDGGSVMYIKDSGYKSAVGIIRVNENKSFQFPLNVGRIQSIDW